MASKSALFIGWNRSFPGREALAIETFGAFLNLLGKAQKEGTIESFEPVALEGHGGDLNGFVLIRGDHDKIHNLTHSEAFQSLWIQGLFTVDKLGMTEGYLGEDLQKRMAGFGKLAAQHK
jgi:hypothetical protein